MCVELWTYGGLNPCIDSMRGPAPPTVPAPINSVLTQFDPPVSCFIPVQSDFYLAASGAFYLPCHFLTPFLFFGQQAEQMSMNCGKGLLVCSLCSSGRFLLREKKWSLQRHRQAYVSFLLPLKIIFFVWLKYTFGMPRGLNTAFRLR